MKSRLLAVIVECGMVAACVSPSATLSDSSGHTMQCSASGFGLITGEMAKSRFNACVAQAKNNGYKINDVRN